MRETANPRIAWLHPDPERRQGTSGQPAR